MKFEWKEISTHKHGHYQTHRAKVFGGWLVRYTEFAVDVFDNLAMVFIPDHDHRWDVDEVQRPSEN
jgi:hypothetical protein